MPRPIQHKPISKCTFQVFSLFQHKASLSPDVSHWILSYHSRVAKIPTLYANSCPCWHQPQLALPVTYRIKREIKKEIMIFFFFFNRFHFEKNYRPISDSDHLEFLKCNHRFQFNNSNLTTVYLLF